MFDRRPDEILMEITQRGLSGIQQTITVATTWIKTGEDGLHAIDDALTGNRPKYGETPGEAFMGVLDMLQGTLEEAREKKSATDPTVVQHSREILSRLNDAEPSWKPAPMVLRSPSDVFRRGLRDLKGHTSLIRLASGQGTINDLEGLAKWAEDLNQRIELVKQGMAPPTAIEGAQTAVEGPVMLTEGTGAAPKPKATRRPKKDTTPKKPPADADVVLAKAVAEEMNDPKVTGWFEDFSKGKISEAQWISRLTNHAAATRDTLDDVMERALARVNKAGNGK